MACKGNGGRAVAEGQGGHVTSLGGMIARTVVAVCGFLLKCSAVAMWQCGRRQRTFQTAARFKQPELMTSEAGTCMYASVTRP
jgi:hypothetical protein